MHDEVYEELETRRGMLRMLHERIKDYLGHEEARMPLRLDVTQKDFRRMAEELGLTVPEAQHTFATLVERRLIRTPNPGK